MLVDLEQALIPPEDLIMDGSSSTASYLSVGADMLKVFREQLPLRPDMRVLELGSAAGRISRQFVNILSGAGEFVGVEIMPKPVEWCQREIGGRFPNFRFIHADIYNSLYNPQGRIKASAYVFPLPDEQVDLVLLTSVFTHMLRQDIARYLLEIRRVLRPGGLCFATFFLYAAEEFAKLGTAEARPNFFFPIYREQGRVLSICQDNEFLEEAVAYERDFIGRLYRESGLHIERELPGSWLLGRTGIVSYQDALIARK
jgi:SAM-dependent methyltransferase